MHALRILSLACLVTALVVSVAARTGAEPRQEVAIELVLAIDTSASVNEREYRLQIEGIAHAFRHPDAIAAIAALGPGGLAVALLQWSEPREARLSVPFAHITSERDAKAFAFLVSLVPRAGRSSLTDIGSGLSAALAAMETGPYEGRRRIIDISGDGRSNAGQPPAIVRRQVLSRGVVINGLAILTDEPWLKDYYREFVIGGPGSFVEAADDYDSFADAFLRKLLRELLPRVGEVR